MCGIAGVLHPDPSLVPAGEVERMIEVLAHRGPDGHGVHREPGVALGHRRLNVIDIDGGSQPMSNEDGTVWVTFNGEIYNFQSLRRELTARGHVFTSRCDTEVLVHGYEQWGDELVEHLSGMFAFAIWDSTRRRALLARDRMGQKPLCYAHLDDGRLIFGSEAKALVAHPDFDPAVDSAGLAAYLTYEYLPTTLSMFRGVRRLLPGHVLTYDSGALSSKRYWDIPFGNRFEGTYAEAEQRFSDAFDKAVRRRLVADVPLGVFLSGGIDSSAVAAVAVQHQTTERVKTFSIGFHERSFDESSYARVVARYLGTDHHDRIFDANALLDTLPRVLSKLDEPFGDASLLPTFLLSEFTRETVTVALGGDGGDELLFGYPTFRAEMGARVYSRLPVGLRRFVSRQLHSLPVDTRNFSLDFVAKSFLKAGDAPPDTRHPLWLASFAPGSADDPLRRELRRQYSARAVLAPAVDAYHGAPSDNPLQRLSYQYCKTYLAEDILTKVDRASMAVSLEVRSPFLDHELVELIASLPPAFKSRRLESKRVLRGAFRNRLPKAVLKRPKKGFGIPVAEWLKGPLRDRAIDLLASDRIKRAGFLRADVVTRLLEEHLRGRRDNRKPLWTLLMFEMWRDRYGL